MPKDQPRNGQRMLAAILFSDAVGFSQRAGRDETAAIEAIQADLALMTEVCHKWEGDVLKSTGDGLLMTFSSAVQAVQCALDIQRQLDEKALSTFESEPLVHRMGVHLGDVILAEGDILGDGVNIASRLQAEALPGGIYLSQTVYDVVRGKVPLNAVFMGPRRLKNIDSPVPAWQVPPLGASVDVFLGPVEPEPVVSSTRPPILSRGGPAALCGAVVASVVLVLFGMATPKPTPASLGRAQALYSAPPTIVVPAPPVTVAEKAPVLLKADAPVEQPKPIEKPVVTPEKDPEPVKNETPSPEGPTFRPEPLPEKAATWMREKLAATSEADPIVVPPPKWAALPETRVWSDGEGGLVFERGEMIEKRSLREVAPMELAAIGMALVRKVRPSPEEGREVVQMLNAFARKHSPRQRFRSPSPAPIRLPNGSNAVAEERG
ncbi:MAG: hypothetical protein K1X67_19745 [Fimbriimonadaceae bacterium]|nr:hypothetical protein [Fimbriimonadaceae bacterium]